MGSKSELHHGPLANIGSRAAIAVAAGLLAPIWFAGDAHTAQASGGTRALTFYHTHTHERTTVTFWREGRYDDEGLRQLNWFLRDWRMNEPAKMDPQLFSVLWEVHRETGSKEPIHIISAYRSPQTNTMLRNRSKGVSEQSQHMLGKAMDVRFPDVDSTRLRAIAMRLQYGGVGYYASSDFVHVDTGNVRAWPRMSQEQLSRLFPEGKTVHLPPSGKPLARYEEAKAEILVRKQMLASAAIATGPMSSVLAPLFGREPMGGDPESAAAVATASIPPAQGIAIKADSVVPMPPRRPDDVEPPPAADSARSVAARIEKDRSNGAESEYATRESRMLFSGNPISASLDRADFGSLYSGMHVAMIFDEPLIASPFLGRPLQDVDWKQFSGPAVKPLRTLQRSGENAT